MDPQSFQDNAPGRLVPIENEEKAFAPHPLPPDLTLGEQQYTLLMEARELIGEIRGLTHPKLLPDPNILFRPLLREESLRSSSLEGTFATPEELLQFELNPVNPSSKHDPSSRMQEVFNHGQALEQAEKSLELTGFTLWLVRCLHGTLMEGVRGKDKSPGEFRKGQVFIFESHRFIPPPAFHVTQCMEELVRYWSEPPDSLPPLVRVALIHYQFETIHPFWDGNGRVGRLLISLMIARWCGLGRPWLHLSGFFEKHKEEYMHSLFNVSAKGAWLPWLDFCLHAVIEQADETCKRCSALLSLRTEWDERVSRSNLAPRTREILNALFAFPAINAAIAKRLTNVKSLNTAYTDLRRLADLGILFPVTDSRPLYYLARDVIKIAHFF